MTMQIVVVYTDMSGLEKTGKMIMRDMNWFPEMVAVETPKAAMWLRCGTRADVVKAQQQMARDHADTRWAVYALPKTCTNPLGEAKRRIMETK